MIKEFCSQKKKRKKKGKQKKKKGKQKGTNHDSMRCKSIHILLICIKFGIKDNFALMPTKLLRKKGKKIRKENEKKKKNNNNNNQAY